MWWIAVVLAAAVVGALVGLVRLDRRAAGRHRAVLRAGQSSPLVSRRPQDELEGWR